MEEKNIKYYSISSKDELDKIKLNLEKILEPTKQHVINKKQNKISVDWNEYEHDKKKYNTLL